MREQRRYMDHGPGSSYKEDAKCFKLEGCFVLELYVVS